MVKSILFDIIVVIGIILIIFGFSQMRTGDVGPLDNPGQSTTNLSTDSLTGKADNITYNDSFYTVPSLSLIKSEAELLNMDYPHLKMKDKKITINIPSGVSTMEVANILEEKGLVERETFLQAIRIFDLETKIKSGSFLFTTEDDIINVLAKILTIRR
jgi:hypothetical protein